MQLLQYNDKKLKEISQPFNFQAPPFDSIEFSQKLVKFMYDNNGICLTAPQVGIPYRIFAMRGAPQNFVCFNPKIVIPGEEKVRLEEISLTYPGLCVKVMRPQHCKVRFAMPNGEVRTETYTGLTARTFQHCMDFLDGRLFYANANPFHRQQALKKWNRS
jgi:peptide deformylase